jgi:putative FmdB family regulatory protein
VPTYQYACTDCGDKSEVVQRFTDDPLTVCTACSGKLRKVFSAVGIVFKGSGFYRTDSRNGSSAAGAGKDGAGKDGAGKDGAGKDKAQDTGRAGDQERADEKDTARAAS